MEKHLLIYRFLLPSQLERMVASRHVVASVRHQFFFSFQLINAQDLRVASKFMIDTGAGVIDADYRGVVFVLLFNLSDKDFQGT
jgi:dUTPase